jgi:hypothetical protein
MSLLYGANGEQDVVDLLADQHGQIERLFQRVLQSEGDDRHRRSVSWRG